MESRFGFTVDYDNLSYAKAQRLNKALSENIASIKRSFGSHTAEKNAKYMELLLVKEGLDRWLNSEQGLFESEMGRSEAVLAAKDIVDSVQDMLENGEIPEDIFNQAEIDLNSKNLEKLKAEKAAIENRTMNSINQFQNPMANLNSNTLIGGKRKTRNRKSKSSKLRKTRKYKRF